MRRTGGMHKSREALKHDFRRDLSPDGNEMVVHYR